ncbi:MAG TPA: STAS domain-containing protein [Limnobacter sp.]|nr:STAS domain-containing protein [Limnobacter sp.]
MNPAPQYQVSQLFCEQRDAICEEWLGRLSRLWSRNYPGFLNEEELRHQLFKLLDVLALQFSSEVSSPEHNAAREQSIELIRQLGTSRARQGFKPSDTAQFVFMLKNICTGKLTENKALDATTLSRCLIDLQDVLDSLSLANFDSYVETREKVIAQQSLSLQELSSPVIRLWDQMLLLPLVGVVDTFRARQVTERLLEAITRYEATVTIIDVTGVPVFDTGVARHIMKAIDAAQLLGSRIVMTGISPEGAQTLTRLGITFSGVISRASLRAGVAEAFTMTGRKVVRQAVGSTS